MNTPLIYRIARLVPKRLRRRLLSYYWDYRVNRSPDRVFYVTRILPELSLLGGNILIVGCASYARDYHRILEQHGGTCWTIDYDPEIAVWGHPERHVIGDVRQLDRLMPGITFDMILCNGIFGFGITDKEGEREALKAMAAVMRPGGLLLLSWALGKTADPIAAGLTETWFEPYAPAGFEQRHVFTASRHVFDFFKKK